MTKPSLPPLDEFIRGLEDIWDSHILTNYGPKHKLLRERLIEYLRVKHISLLTNGHQALEIALSTLELTGEVITTPFTFASTTHAIVRSGLTPVFCDIRPDTLNIDETKIEALITDKTSAILPVHVYGTPCEVDAIDDIAKRHKLKVVYDAAHAFGVTINGKGIGNFGDISMFSFHATKVFNTIEGGALTFNDARYEKEVYLRQNFGIENAEEVLLSGTNAKMNEFQALMGLLNLKHIDQGLEHRAKAYKKYCDFLSNIDGIQPVSNKNENVKYSHSYFPILVSDSFPLNRDELFQHLQENNVFSRKYFYPLVTDYACYKGKFRGSTPVATRVANQVLCLPLHSEMKISDIELITALIGECAK